MNNEPMKGYISSVDLAIWVVLIAGRLLSLVVDLEETPP